MELLSKRYFLSRIIIASICSMILMIIAFQPIIGLLIKYAQNGFVNMPSFDTSQLIPFLPKMIFLSALAVGFSIYGIVLTLICLYRSWQAIQDHETRTTPGIAVGFLFIPLFNFYWMFRAIGDYPKEYNNYARRHLLQAKPLAYGPYRTIPWLNLAGALIPYAVFITGLIEAYLMFVLIGRTCDAVNALDGAPAVAATSVTTSTPIATSSIPPLLERTGYSPPPTPARAVIHCSKCGQPSTYGLLICMACGTAFDFSKPEPTPSPAVAEPSATPAAEPVPPLATTPQQTEKLNQPPPIPTEATSATTTSSAAATTPPATSWRVESHSLTDTPPLNATSQPTTEKGPATTLPNMESSAPLPNAAAPSQPSPVEPLDLDLQPIPKPTPVSPTPATTADVSAETAPEPPAAEMVAPAPPKEAATPQPAAAEPPARPVDQLTMILTEEPKSPALMKLLHLPRPNDLAMLRYVNQPLNLITVEGVQEQFNPQDYTEADLLWAEGVMALMSKIKAKIVTGDFTEVLSLILKGLQLAPGEEKLLLALADCYTELGEFGRAIKVLESAQQLYPDNSRVQINLELVRAKIG